MEKNLQHHHPAKDMRDRAALSFVKFLRFFADAFFAKRYGHRAIVLETIAAVPGMVAGGLIHFRCLRRLQEDYGWIETLLDEAQNERMHLMTFVQIERPTLFERWLIIAAQFVFSAWYFFIYVISPKTAHRIVGYLEEEAVISYTEFLKMIEQGEFENHPAPATAIEYWDLPEDARLREVVMAVRADEMKHRDVNHGMADQL